jgi:hypothetical protein
MRFGTSHAARLFFNTASWGAALAVSVAALCLAVLANAVFDMLTRALGQSTVELWKIAGIAVAALFLAIGVVVYLIRRRLRVTRQLSERMVEKRRGLIILVSRQPDVAKQAIAYHKDVLKRCWLICSEETLPTAQQLPEEFPGITFEEPIILRNVFDPLECRDRVDRIYREHRPSGWHENEIIADFTGMTACASVGKALACLSEDRPLQYIRPKERDRDLRGRKPGDPIEIALV